MTLHTMSTGRRRVAVIGGGVSGALLVLALLRERSVRDIVIHEPSAVIGPGIAYGTAAPWHLLNVIATRASLYEDDPDHWRRWACEHGPRLGWPETAAATGRDYLPRRLFGHYVVAELERARQGRNDVRVLHHRSAVADIIAADGGFSVIDAVGGTSEFDAVVLATGAPLAPGFDLPGLADLRTHDLWFDNPWDTAALARIPRDKPVLILGSALTMADTVLTLAQQKHVGPIHILSRHGIVPAARHEQPVLPTGISSDEGAVPLSQLLRRLRHAVRVHGAARWQGVFEGLRNSTNELWLALPTDAQRRFMRHLKGLWDAHRFRMPPTTAACLDNLRQRGQLQFHKGRLRRVQRQDDRIAVEYRPRGSDSSEVMMAAAIIDCAGPYRPEIDWAGRLHSRLLASGLLARAACGTGFAATPEGGVRDPAGSVVEGLYLLGPLLRGTLLESTAINELRGQANVLARRLATEQQDLLLRDRA